jgi:hypothetical protein
MFASSESRIVVGLLSVLLPSALATAAEPELVRGRIASVDAAAKTLKLETAGGDVTLVVAPESRLVVDGKAVRLEDLKEGRYVRVAYKDQSGAKQVVSLSAAVVTDEELKRRIAEALDATKRYAHKQKDEFAAKVGGVVEDLDDRIDRLQMEMKGATAEAKVKLQARIDALKKMRSTLSDRLAKIRAAAADAWDDVKSGFGNAARDLQKALDAGS